MSRCGRCVGGLMAIVVLSLGACTAEGGSGDRAAACVNRFTYEGRTYRDVGQVRFTAGEKLGSATRPPCNDTGGQEADEIAGETGTAYAVDGISPEVAIAVGDTADDATFFVSSSFGTELPQEVRELVDGSR